MSARVVSNSIAQSELVSTLHDRQRREERQIQKTDLLRARRFGMQEPGNSRGRIKYTLSGKVFIYDPQRNMAITCFESRDKQGVSSGSRFVDPVMIEKSSDHEGIDLERAHELMHMSALSKKNLWKSHTILVVDMSGSMRTDDVDGARCRSDGVWTCLAREFVKNQLEQHTTTLYDLVSIVVMRQTATVVIRHEPMTWVLYNKLVDLREWTNLKPEGPGFYLPALKEVHSLLRANDLGSCALSVFFFSDGRPSESQSSTKQIVDAVGTLASQFGRRLSLCCVGMASPNEDFSVLKKMVDEAIAFGAVASFNRPSLDANSLSHIISHHVSSLTMTKTEMTETKTGKGKTVRTDIVRERVDAPDDQHPTDDWRIFRASSDEKYTKNIWKWNDRDGNFCLVIDRRCNGCYKVVADQDWQTGNRGKVCKGCKALYLCTRCMAIGVRHPKDKCLLMADRRRKGLVQKETILAYNVAWKRTCFGEGAERAAYKFRYLNLNDEFMGPVMVAKESRFVEDDTAATAKDASSYLKSHRHSYHLQFMTTQALASRCAKEYNSWLDRLAVQNPQLRQRFTNFPRIRFLRPLIFELADAVNSKMYNILVEPFIEGVYRKYNGNFGGVAKAAPVSDDNTGLSRAAIESLLGRKANIGVINARPLAALVEESEEEEDSDDDGDWNEGAKPARKTGDNTEYFDHLIGEQYAGAPQILLHEAIPVEDFAHAFSHFSYYTSKKQFMVVDLQGSMKEYSDGRREFIFTDPAVHKRKESPQLQGMKFGRTNLGEKGIRAFFETHVCNGACQLFGLTPETAMGQTPDELFCF
ncbi:hypothetical protein MPSEU_000228700 [Mayamaea pseudoterrestris]|nr:hypothetical protein MPSEU_000228700 [Mayamaea pseudoterrestris]